MIVRYYGVSTGETGNYGVGDLVVGDGYNHDDGNGGYLVDGEPCYNVFIISNGKVKYVDLEGEF